MLRGRTLMTAAAVAVALLCTVPGIFAGTAPSVSAATYPLNATLADTTSAAADSLTVTPAQQQAIPKPRGLVKGVGEQRRNRPVIKPLIPLADRTDRQRVFLEYADTLRYVKPPVNLITGLAPEPYQLLIGNVKVRKDAMWMYCDSAHFYETGDNFEAFGNVRMEQGDTLFVYGDELNYIGEDELATMYSYPGKKVRLINRDVKLETDVFNYNLNENVGYYEVGGVLTDKTNRLTSTEGEYYPDTKMAYFYRNVQLTGLDENDTLRMYTDTLEYNTDTHVAIIVDRTRIISKDGDITTTSGMYDTNTGLADLYSRSTVHTRRGNTLTGDTIIYNKENGFGEAFGMVIMTDSARKSMVEGDYAYYNEITDSAVVIGRALAKEYSHGDTLYIHGDTIMTYLDPVDSTKITNVYHKVRFYRTDMQGICDSLSYAGADSVVYMYRHPVVWSDERQIFGNVIMLHLNDSTIDWARLPDFAFMAEHVGEDCYNQLTGSDMTAWFNDKSELYRLYVEGNLQMIMFPMENDSTYNKFAFVESSNLNAYFKDNNIDRAHIWPENNGNVTPLYLAKKSSYRLSKFAWYEDLRPMTPGDVFIVPQGMIDLIESAPPVKQRKRVQRGDAKPNESAPAEEPVAEGDSIPVPEAAEAPETENGDNDEGESAENEDDTVGPEESDDTAAEDPETTADGND